MAYRPRVAGMCRSAPAAPHNVRQHPYREATLGCSQLKTGVTEWMLSREGSASSALCVLDNGDVQRTVVGRRIQRFGTRALVPLRRVGALTRQRPAVSASCSLVMGSQGHSIDGGLCRVRGSSTVEDADDTQTAMTRQPDGRVHVMCTRTRALHARVITGSRQLA